MKTKDGRIVRQLQAGVVAANVAPPLRELRTLAPLGDLVLGAR